MKQAIVLCSGGLDSVTTAFYVRKKLKYRKIKLLFFNYGQRNMSTERKAVVKCAKRINANLIELDISYLKEISHSLLNSSKKHRHLSRKDLKNTVKESEKWYVPARNLIFLANALSFAESLRKINCITDIFVGFKNEGAESFPDTSKEFLRAINEVSKISTNGKYKILAPLIDKDKEDIVLLGKKLGVVFEETFSCYTGTEIHCGDCLACRLRQEGFYWSGVGDPTKYMFK